TLTESAVARMTVPGSSPPNVTVTWAGLNLSSEVPRIVSVATPVGFFLDSTPLNTTGNTFTVTIPVSPPPVTVTVVCPPLTPVTTKPCVAPSGNTRAVSTSTVAMAGVAEVALRTTGTGLSCASRATTTRDTVLPGSTKLTVGVRERTDGRVRTYAVGSFAHARATNAHAAHNARMYCRFMFALRTVGSDRT